MKVLFITLSFISLASISLAIASPTTREVAHNQAVKELSQLHFFYKGRGMAITPNLISMYDLMKENFGFGSTVNSSVHTRWGLAIDNKEIKGLFNVPYENLNIGVLGCIACHGGKAAGVYIPGLGNKNIDVGQIGADAYLIQKLWALRPGQRGAVEKEIHQRAVEFTKGLSDKKISNLTQGLVPTSLIRTWFYTIQNLEIPESHPREQTKVPHIWGYGEKRKSGSFCDGQGNGVLPGWAVAVELYAGQTPENVREYEKEIHHAEDLFSDLLPPPYPFEIDLKAAQNGEKIYLQNCQGCHGTYQRDQNQLAIFESPKHIPWSIIRTDKKRLEGLTDEFLKLIETNPLKDLMQYIPKNELGYVAPRLWGVWARFPYLHNASVPSLYSLLSPPDQRPEFFSLKHAGELYRFDKKNVGLTVPNKNDTSYQKLFKAAKTGKRDVYWTQRDGQSNQGHWFSFSKNLSEQDKYQLIEYLKTL